MTRRDTLQLKILGMAISLAVLATVLVAWLALAQFRVSLMEDMHEKAVDVGESVTALMAKAVGHGEPFEHLPGMGDYLDSVRKTYPEILYLAVTDAAGNVIYRNGAAPTPAVAAYLRESARKPSRDYRTLDQAYVDTAVAVNVGGKTVGWLHVGQDAGYIQKQFEDIALDLVTIIVVTSLIAFELLVFVVMFKVTAPMAAIAETFERVQGGDYSQYLTVDFLDEIGRVSSLLNKGLSRVNSAYAALAQRVGAAQARFGEQTVGAAIGPLLEKFERRFLFGAADYDGGTLVNRLVYIRWPFFLLIFSDSLSLSFFPNFVAQFYHPIGWLSREVVIGLPISVFMFVWALSLPIGGQWSERVGHRRAFIVGALVTALGLILTATSQNMLELLMWRSITAVGYGIVFITVQGYITANTSAPHRTKGMAMFLSGFFAGSLCGAATGGILADHIGYSMTFFLSAFLGLAAVLFVRRFIPKAPPAQEAKPKLKWSDFKALVGNKSFMAITLLSAIPSKIALTGFLYYTVPLFIKYLGGNQSLAGRGIMAYGLAIIVFSPLVARLVDRGGSRKPYVLLGSFFSGVALLLLYFFDSTLAVIASVTFLGIAHSFSVSSQMTLVTELCKEDCNRIGVGTVMGIFRLMERIGNVAGPLIAGTLIAVYGFSGAFLGIGTVIIVSIGLLALYLYQADKPVLEGAL